MFHRFCRLLFFGLCRGFCRRGRFNRKRRKDRRSFRRVGLDGVLRWRFLYLLCSFDRYRFSGGSWWLLNNCRYAASAGAVFADGTFSTAAGAFFLVFGFSFFVCFFIYRRSYRILFLISSRTIPLRPSAAGSGWDGNAVRGMSVHRWIR
jgi:hypothetical protein